ncbi:GNAT family N-acetyltransferase, partial [Anoxybacillus sp. J5B_2022]|uniref:GNAT family N-acetyltransferase n=1 Tax=Anoxybacillus sp. J5B_2022 TaxID=3003246 RepID=UPI00228672AF
INEGELYIARVGTNIVGVQLLVPPIPKSFVDLDSYFNLINSKMVTGYRMVVHPEFRSMGVGRKLAVDAPKLAGYEIIETRSALYHYIPIPEHWGYTNADKYFDDIYWKDRPANMKLEQYIIENGFDPNLFVDDDYCLDFIRRADRKKLSQLIMEDRIEQGRSVLLYYFSIMAECGYPYDGNVDTLIEKFKSKIWLPNDDEDLVKGLKNHKQVRYGAFFRKLK